MKIKNNILKTKYNKTITNLFNQKHTPNTVLPKNKKKILLKIKKN